MSAIKTVALLGASGSLGTKVLDALISSGQFSITAIKRQGSKSQFPASVKVVEVDYDSVESLTNAFKGFDAVVSTVSALESPVELNVIDAGIAAGVKRLIPSEFGSDLANPKTSKLPVFGTKIPVLKRIEEASQQNPNFTYTTIRNAAFLDWGLEQNFLLDLSQRKPAIFYGGDRPFSSTTLATVAQAIIGVLNHLEETKNRALYIQDLVITQNQLLNVAKKLTPGEKWEPVQVDNTKQVEASNEDIRTGQIKGLATFAPYLFQSLFEEGYGGEFKNLDNELLGLKGLKEDAIEDILRPLLVKS